MVSGHNLRYMAPFDFSRAGFCMVFRRASFVFSCPGTDFGGPGRILDPRGRHFGPGKFLEVLKNIFLQRNDVVVRIQGDPSCPNEFYGPEELHGQATLSKKTL